MYKRQILHLTVDSERNNNGNQVIRRTNSKTLLNIDELDNAHNTFLHSVRSHKLLLANSDSNIGTYSGNPYPISLMIIMETVFKFIEFYSKLNDISEKVLIQLNLADTGNLGDLLTQFTSASLSTVQEYKRFNHQLYVFCKDLKSDDEDDLRVLSRMLR